MTIRDLPKAKVAARPGMPTESPTTALNRWNPAIRAADEGESDASISILDVIGEDIFGDGVSSKRVAAALRQIGKRDVVVNINSPGGDYFEGLTIYNMLREHPAKVRVRILGMAASAASIIAMAGDEVQIARAGFVMIHNVWTRAMGDRNDLRAAADWLEPFDQAAADIYAARTGIEPAKISEMLDTETWIGGSAAVDEGFADGLLDSDEIDAQAQAEGKSPLLAARKIDRLLAKAGASRSERRGLVAALKGGTPSAAPTGTPGAAVTEGLQQLLKNLQSI